MIDVPFLDLRPQLAHLREAARSALDEVLAGGTLVLGPAVTGIEAAFADYCGVKHGVGVASGTDAIALALAAAGVRPGDEVIAPALTCAPTISAIFSIGAVPVLADVHPDDWTLDPAELPVALSPRTRAIVPVHLYGRPANMKEILAFAEANGLRVIADAAQAHGASWSGDRSAVLGHAAAFSFYPTKNLACLGDGGMVVTDDPELANEVRTRRQYGLADDLAIVSGRNSRLDELQAAVLLRSLDQLDAGNDRRRAIAKRYSANFSGLRAQLQYQDPAAESSWHLFVLAVSDRERFQRVVAGRGVGTAVHYPHAVHQHPAFANSVGRAGSLATSEFLAKTVVSLPLNPRLTDDQVEQVITAVDEALDIA